ncbi:MAG: hypothetical protein ACI4JY_07170 [Oscillospiraceae bacterium]
MNKARRKRASAIEEKLRALLEEVEELIDEEQEAFDNLPENFKHSEHGAAIVDIFANLDDIYSLVITYRGTTRAILRRLRGE